MRFPRTWPVLRASIALTVFANAFTRGRPWWLRRRAASSSLGACVVDLHTGVVSGDGDGGGQYSTSQHSRGAGDGDLAVQGLYGAPSCWS
jgi:hypothetical protein